MISITIDGNRVSVFDAIEWASKQFGNSFSVKNEFPDRSWKFSFERPEQATLFALQWVK